MTELIYKETKKTKKGGWIEQQKMKGKDYIQEQRHCHKEWPATLAAAATSTPWDDFAEEIGYAVSENTWGLNGN